jgi:hypothetical protein
MAAAHGGHGGAVQGLGTGQVGDDQGFHGQSSFKVSFGWSRHLSALDGLIAKGVPGRSSARQPILKPLKIKGFL